MSFSSSSVYILVHFSFRVLLHASLSTFFLTWLSCCCRCWFFLLLVKRKMTDQKMNIFELPHGTTLLTFKKEKKKIKRRKRAKKKLEQNGIQSSGENMKSQNQKYVFIILSSVFWAVRCFSFMEVGVCVCVHNCTMCICLWRSYFQL